VGAFRLAFVLLAGAAFFGSPALAARQCSVIDEDARQAQKAGELERLIELYTEAHDPAAACDAPYLADFGRDVALAHIDRFFSFYDKDKDGAAHKQILEAGRQFGEPWQLLLTLAEVEAELGNTELTASYYQQAVRGMETASRSADADSGVAKNLPSAEEFQSIYTKMAEAALLAETFSPPAVSRGDETGGLFADSYRGYVVKEVPVPVQFQFASTRFTAKGEQVAAYLLDYLLGSNLPKIKLIGHTDPVGSDDFNQGLSVRRAEAVKSFLAQGGYTGQIEVEGRGESEPFKPVDPERFANDVEAKNQLDRRVELVRNPDH
jgi:outer membrane protein OmpA-like peptidoglycan-associated protein